MKRRDKPREPVVWSAVGVSLRSDIPSLLWASGVVLDCCLDMILAFPCLCVLNTGCYAIVEQVLENLSSSELHHLSGDIRVPFSHTLSAPFFPEMSSRVSILRTDMALLNSTSARLPYSTRTHHFKPAVSWSVYPLQTDAVS